MEWLGVVIATSFGLVLFAILSVFYLLKRQPRGKAAGDWAGSETRIPTIPVMDPDSFKAEEGPGVNGTP